MLNKGSSIDRLTQLLRRLPGLGPRSARRVFLHMVKYKQEIMQPLAKTLQEVYEDIVICGECGNMDVVSPCVLCQDEKRWQTKMLMIVEDITDLWAIERAGCFAGMYHVLGGHLNSFDDVGPEKLNIDGLVKRVNSMQPNEVILALNATVNSETTAYFLHNLLESAPCKPHISRLAHGIPMGGELDYLDEGTLQAALSSRQSF